MIFRFLILVIILLSASCNGKLQNADKVCVAECQESFLNGDNSDNTQNVIFSWFGLIANDCAPVIRTNARLRPVHRIFEKRKLLSNNALTVIFSTNILKHLAQKRLFVCHLKNFGGTLLYFSCKLSR